MDTTKINIWQKFKNIFFVTLIYAALLIIALIITGILSNVFSSREAGAVGVTLIILLFSSCFFSRKFEDNRFVKFLKIFLPAVIFYMTWNIAAELTMWAFLENSWPHWMIIPALITSWSAKLVTWLLPFLLYRNMCKKENNGSAAKEMHG